MDCDFQDRVGMSCKLCCFVVISVACLCMLAGCTAPQHAEKVDHAMVSRSERKLDSQAISLFSTLDAHYKDQLYCFLTEVLDHNPDVNSLRASLAAAQQLVPVVAAAQQPQVQLSATALREKSPLDYSLQDTRALGVEASWTLDIWGQISDEKAVAKLSVLQQQQTLRWSSRLLVAQAIDLWLTHIALHNQSELLAQMEQAQSRIVSVAERYYVAGVLNFEVLLAERQFHSSVVQDQQTLDQEIKSNLHALNTLRGNHPTTPVLVDFPNVLVLPIELPQAVSADVLINRPDILSAYTELQLFDRQTRAAHKALLPQLTLTGTASKESVTFPKALDETVLWQLVGGITQPIWRGGELRARARAAVFEAESAWWRYQQVVAQALQELEDTLIQQRSEYQKIRLQQDVVARQSQVQRIRGQQYLQGDAGVIDHLQANLQRLQAEMQLLQQQWRYLHLQVTLALVLGAPLEQLGGDFNVS